MADDNIAALRDYKLGIEATKGILKDIASETKQEKNLLAHGDLKSAALVGREIAAMKAELARRTVAAADKTARAATIAGLVTRQAIRDKNLSVVTNVQNRTATYINGRLLDSNLSRYKSVIVGSRGTFAEFG